MSVTGASPSAAAVGVDPADAALWDTLLARVPLGLAFFDTRRCFRRVNQAFAELDGYAAEEHIGRRPSDLLDAALAEPLEEALGSVVEQDEALADREFKAEIPPGSGAPRHLLSHWFPAHDDTGQMLGVALLVRDVTETRRSHEELRRSWERYRSLAQASEQVVWVATPEGKIHEDSQEWHAITGQTFEEYAGYGWLDAIHPEDRQAVEQAWQRAVETESALECEYRLHIRSGQYRNYSSRAIPIVRDGEIVEWVGASTDVTAAREAEQTREHLNQQLSAAALRTARLQQVTSMLAEALTVDDVARTVAEVGRSAIGADRASVAVYEKERARLRVVGDVPDLPVPQPSVFSVTAPTVHSYAVREREDLVAASSEELRRLLPGAETDDFLARTDEQSWVGLPLLTSGDPIGAVRFSFTRPRTVSTEEQTFLQAVASQCALAIERATLYERERRTAETLQASLLPGPPPQPPGLVVAGRYSPAGPGVRVSGDWYDAFEVPDGRLALVVGDVIGKGVLAAAGMGRVRSALRALALSDPEPTPVLAGLDTLFAATEAEEQITTVLYSLLDPASGELLVGNAGHPPLVIVAPDGRPRVSSYEPDWPLGAPRGGDGQKDRELQRHRLAPGETAVAFSDGLVETRRRSVEEGTQELVAVAEEAAPEVRANVDALLDFLTRRMLAERNQDDDVTLLAVHVCP